MCVLLKNEIMCFKCILSAQLRTISRVGFTTGPFKRHLMRNIDLYYSVLIDVSDAISPKPSELRFTCTSAHLLLRHRLNHFFAYVGGKSKACDCSWENKDKICRFYVVRQVIAARYWKRILVWSQLVAVKVAPLCIWPAWFFTWVESTYLTLIQHPL